MKQILNKHWEISNQGVEPSLQTSLIHFVTRNFFTYTQQPKSQDEDAIFYANNTIAIENSKLTLDLVLSAKALKIDISAFSDKDGKELLNDDAIKHFKYIEESIDSYQKYAIASAKNIQHIANLCLKHDELFNNLINLVINQKKENDNEKKQQLN